MRINLRYIILLVLLTAIGVQRSAAQLGFDMGTVEACIDDHKRIRSRLEGRNIIEYANTLLHENSKDANVEYKDINAQLDKYTRCFDIIDVIYTGATLVFNVKNTYNDVSEKVSGMKTLLERYKERVIEKEYRQLKGIGGQMASIKDINSISSGKEWYNDAMNMYNNKELAITGQDTIIFEIGSGICTAVAADADILVKSLTDLVLYATGAAACSTENMMTVLTNINETLDHIRLVVDKGYLALWKYIMIRTGYWTRALTPHHTIREICEGAYGRWQSAQRGTKGISVD